MPRKIINLLVFIILFITYMDLIVNPYKVREIMKQSSMITIDLNNYLSPMKDNSIFITNGISLDDLYLYNNYEIYFTHYAGHSSPNVVDNLNKLNEQIINNPAKNMYYLELNFDYRDYKRFFHQHKYVAGCITDLTKIISFNYRKTFLLFDFPTYFINREYWNFLGPPDFQDDYYYGPSKNSLEYEFSSMYNLYSIDSAVKHQYIPKQRLIFLEKKDDYYYYKANNIFYRSKNYYDYYREMCLAEDDLKYSESLSELKEIR